MRTPQKIALLFLEKEALYHTALSQIYPQKPILCGLLWTQSPRLDLIPEALMEKFTHQTEVMIKSPLFFPQHPRIL
jgi:ATP-dependent helicase/nuclease subunit A